MLKNFGDAVASLSAIACGRNSEHEFPNLMLDTACKRSVIGAEETIERACLPD